MFRAQQNAFDDVVGELGSPFYNPSFLCRARTPNVQNGWDEQLANALGTPHSQSHGREFNE
jgi:hypothetical protein